MKSIPKLSKFKLLIISPIGQSQITHQKKAYAGSLKREKAKNSGSVLGGSLPFTIAAAPAVITRAVNPQIRSAHPNPT